MINTSIRWLVRLVWTLALTALILTAVYVSLGRLLLTNLPSFQQEIETYLSQTLGKEFVIDGIAGDWAGLQPLVAVRGLRVGADIGQEDLRIESLAMRLDVLRSLVRGAPLFSSLEIRGANLRLERDGQGGWRPTLTLPTAPDTDPWQRLSLLLEQQHIQIRDSRLTFVFAPGREQALTLPLLELTTVKGFAASQGRIALTENADEPLRYQANLSRDAGGFSLEAYIDLEPVQLERWQPLVDELLPLDLNLKQAHLGGRFWLQWDNRQGIDLRGELRIPVLEFDSGSFAIEPVTDIGADFVWRYDPAAREEISSLRLKDFTFSWHDELFAPAQQRWSWVRKEGRPQLHLVAEAIDLEFSSNTLLAIEQVPEQLKEILRTLQPRGRLLNAYLSYEFAATERLGNFDLEANLARFEVAPWRAAPAIAGLDGYVRASLDGGELQFASADLSLHFPRLFDEGWHFDQVAGGLRWHNQGKGVWFDSDLIRFDGDLGRLVGRFSLALPEEGELESRIDILLGLQDADAVAALRLVPDRPLNPNLLDWLGRAIQQGRIPEARFLYSGTAKRSEAAFTTSLDLDLTTQDLNLNYHHEWPPLEQAQGRILVNERQADIRVAQAKLQGLQVEQLQARWQNGEPWVSLVGEVSGDAAQGLKILQQTPVRAALFDLVDEMQAQGETRGELALRIPLSAETGVDLELEVAARAGTLAIPSLDLEFEAIDGKLHYSTAQGIRAEQLSARLFDQPVSVQIATRPTEVAAATAAPAGNDRDSVAAATRPAEPEQARVARITELRLAGRVAMDDLFAWKANPLQQRITGSTAYQAIMTLGPEEKSLSLSSDLQGVAVNAPYPYGKDAEHSQDFELRLPLAGPPVHRLDYGELFHYALLFEQRTYRRGELRLGLGEANFGTAEGIAVRGSLPRIDLNEWAQFFASLDQEGRTATALGDAGANLGGSPNIPASVAAKLESEPENTAVRDWWTLLRTPQGSALEFLDVLEIQSETLTVADNEVRNLILQAERLQSGWWLQLDSQLVKGRVNLFADPDKPLLVELDYLRLGNGDSEGNENDNGEDALASIDPRSLPAMDVTITDFSLGEKDLGTWVFNLRPSAEGAELAQLVMELPGMQISGDVQWRHVQGRHSAVAEGYAYSTDLDAVATAWGYANAIEGNDARITGSFSWQGSPAMFSMQHIQGGINLNVGAGRFIDLETTPRIFGLFNFSSIARRVRLDFSDMLKKGFSFDRVQGDLLFDQGLVRTSSPLIIDGPAAKFRIEGITDLRAGQVDQEVIVVLPLTDIPLAAAIVSLPEVGIPLWLLNRAFGNMFERFTSARYTFKGSWDDPKVELVRIFENRNSPVVPEGVAKPPTENRPSQAQPSSSQGDGQREAGGAESVSGPATASAGLTSAGLRNAELGAGAANE